MHPGPLRPREDSGPRRPAACRCGNWGASRREADGCRWAYRRNWRSPLEDLLRLFLVDPVAAVLDDDAGHVGGVAADLVGYEVAEAALRADREHRHGQPGLDVFGVVLHVLWEGSEPFEIGAQVRRVAQMACVLSHLRWADSVFVNLECVDEPGHPDVLVAGDDVSRVDR